ncbi:MAG TPA: 4-hydroxyphenylacetate 3-hydroxylase N-terminal domain-containing protein [Candidatus Limnocylindria bacterium]|nr:4-hydroxyphenylacetate 3-hydroxylase N-terminal domain-containing protein [Candidatus Limnocylindria bacterium]
MIPQTTRPPNATLTDPYLMTGEGYRRSLRDGRRIIYAGQEVADITAHPAFKRTVDNVAALYDLQFDPAYRDTLTYLDPDTGDRLSTGWLVPRSREDLEKRRETLRVSTLHTLGMYGRPPDYGSTICMGYLSLLDLFEAVDPKLAANIRAFVKAAARRNAMCADVLAEPQSDRMVPNNQKPGRLRVVEERKDGVVIYGGKAVGSLAAAGHYMTIANLLFSDMDPACNIWCQVPVNAKNMTLVSRESVTAPAETGDHPVDAFGDEIDTFFIFDNVFVPWEDIFVYKQDKLLGLYYPVCALAHWHILARLWYRAEIFAGVAQAIVDALGTGGIPGVRMALTEVFAYASTLKAFILAGEKEAKHTKAGVLVPDSTMITAGRLHSLEHYPRVIQIIRDISGQGLVSRFPEATWRVPYVAEKLEEFTAGHGISAKDKNRIFNLAWDLVCGSHASRVALFEHLNAAPPAWIREEIYRSYDRAEALRYVRERAGISAEAAETTSPQARSSFDLVRREAERKPRS